MHAPHVDVLLRTINHSAPSLKERLRSFHDVIGTRYPYIDRIALALYDRQTDLLKTFVSSNNDGHPLRQYEAQLAEVPSLAQLADARQSRVVSDIPQTFQSASRHTAWLRETDYHSSMTVPVYHGEDLSGFIFFDSKLPDAFDQDAARFLEIFADLIAQLFLLQLKVLNGLIGAVQVASALARIRDLETGQHLQRMAAYARLMARAVAHEFDLSDEFIEYLYLFAPLHDIGKVGIPDRVLLKRGKLDAQEWEIMRRHVEIGVGITDKIAEDLGLGDGMAAAVMHNVVACHHERGDGSGYPAGMSMNQIPLEGRIIAVADVYDALTNHRPYKEAWSEEDTLAEMQREVTAGRLDARCVDVLIAAREERLAIQSKFADEPVASEI